MTKKIIPYWLVGGLTFAVLAMTYGGLNSLDDFFDVEFLLFGALPGFILGALLGFIADFITKKREDKNYKPSNKKKGAFWGMITGILFTILFGFIQLSSCVEMGCGLGLIFIMILFPILVLAGLLFGSIVGSFLDNRNS